MGVVLYVMHTCVPELWIVERASTVGDPREGRNVRDTLGPQLVTKKDWNFQSKACCEGSSHAAAYLYTVAAQAHLRCKERQLCQVRLYIGTLHHWLAPERQQT